MSPMIEEMMTYFKKNPVLLVMTKRDILPKSIYEERLLDYMKGQFVDKIMISSKKNYHFDLLMEKIKKYQTSKYVYVVGLTNAGKSTMLNQIIKNYTNLETTITTSMQPSTTLGTIEIPLDETLTLIDTPGILDEGNLLNVVDPKVMKKVIPKKEIKPISYQVKGTQYFWIDDICSFTVTDNNIVIFISNTLQIKRFYKETDTSNFIPHTFTVKEKQDIVIPGLGFIKVMSSGKITIYVKEQVDVFIRKSFI